MGRRIFVLLTALTLPVAGASDAALDRATLRGVAGVNVVIDPVAPEIEREGATASALRARLEQQLRDAGITIDAASNEFVALRLTSVQAARGPLGARGSFALSANIGLYQPVTLVRDHNVRTATQTWEVNTVVLVDSKQVYRACMDSVDELGERFVKAYRSVNTAGTAARQEPGK